MLALVACEKATIQEGSVDAGKQAGNLVIVENDTPVPPIYDEDMDVSEIPFFVVIERHNYAHDGFLRITLHFLENSEYTGNCGTASGTPGYT